MKRVLWKAAAVVVLLLCALPALAENLVLDVEDGVWIGGGGAAVSDQTGFVSGYMTILRGHVIYRDANRTDPLGYPLEECVVYAKRARAYEKGAVYQVQFDTAQTRDGSKCVTGYYYTQYPRTADAEPPAAGARILDGVAIPLIRFHYGAETGAESQFNVVTASGTAYIAKPGTNLREGPGANYNYVARLAKDTKVTITGFNINKNVTWYYVRDDEGNRGFVRADLLADLPSTVAAAPQPEEEQAPPEEGENTEKAESAEDGENTENAEDAEDGKNTENEEDAEDGENTEKEEIAEDGENTEKEENAEDGENTEKEENAEDGENTEHEENTENEEKAENAENTGDADNPEDAENPAEGESAAPERHVRVSLSWEKSGDEPAFGDRAILSAQLEGYDGAAYALQWQTSRDGTAWTDVPGATMPSLILTMTEENYRDYWRVLVTAETPEAGKDAAPGGAEAPEAGE